jgi:hypothetical protein
LQLIASRKKDTFEAARWRPGCLQGQANQGEDSS